MGAFLKSSLVAPSVDKANNSVKSVSKISLSLDEANTKPPLTLSPCFNIFSFIFSLYCPSVMTPASFCILRNSLDKN